ncbi:MAG: hypothetical protein EOP84_05660 [Verrucomicrobiaceae bacterium]|nr:MAG: hypothetical protein EOP84_05660 [Verrucomicrobiaceae bacterium]
MQIVVVPLLFLAGAQPAPGDVPATEVSLSGIHIGDSTSLVERKLGHPLRISNQPDYLNLHYRYKDIIVSFSDGVVAGLFTTSARSCTPKRLCVGDSTKRMRELYGEPLEADRETGRYHEYYGTDLACWLQIPATSDRITSITVACQP